MDQRNLYDLTHHAHVCGKLGRLQTMSCIPVVAGDSIDLDVDAVVRLAPLRKEIVAESQVDLAVFYVPHRHVYQQDWIDFLQQGWDTSTTLQAYTLLDPAFDQRNDFLGIPFTLAGLPMWTIQGYNMIWDRYYRVPSFPRLPNYTVYPTGPGTIQDEYRKYGRLCARLPVTWNDGVRVNGGTGNQAFRDLSAVDSQVPSATTMDLRDMANIQGRYKSEIERTWFTERYKDILERQWKSTVNIDADQRPEMCMRQTFHMSGTDVDGTDDATLGQFVGKTIVRCRMNMPRKYFPEHGALWIMALVRWPSMHVMERHQLATFLSPDAQTILADPDIMENKAPVTSNPGNWIANNVSLPTPDANIQQPYGQWYRAMPNRIHRNFADIPGYPFLNRNFASYEEMMYYQTGDYDDVFQTSQLGHWQAHTKISVDAFRYVPGVRKSVYAGT